MIIGFLLFKFWGVAAEDDLVLALLVWASRNFRCLLLLGFLLFLGWPDFSVDHVVEGAACEFVSLVVHGVELV